MSQPRDINDSPEHTIVTDFPFAPVRVVRMERGDGHVFIATFRPDQWAAVCDHFDRASTAKFEVEWCGYTVICAQS